MCLQLNEHDDDTTVTNVTILTNPCHNGGKAIQIFLQAFDLVDNILRYNGLHEERLRELNFKILSKIQQGQWWLTAQGNDSTWVR